MRLLKAYPTLIKAYFIRSFEYRGQIFIWILSGVLSLIMMMVWLTLAEDGPVQGYDSQDFISYYLMVIFMRRMTGVWIIWDLDREIRLGELSPKLLRPLDPAHEKWAHQLSLRPIQFLLITPLIALASILLGAQYEITVLNILFAAVAVLGAMLIEFFAQFIMASLAFWITQAIAIANAWFYIRALFSGWVVPLDLFPPAVTHVLTYLPFRYILSFPVEIMLGRLSLGEIGLAYAVQFGWVLGLFALYRLIWLRGLRHYGAVGA